MAENTNAGGGELYDKLMALRLEAAEFADEAADNTSGPTSAFEAKERGRASAFAQAAEIVKAALSAQSTGSGGVAAEPVAWAYEELKTYTFDTWEHALSYEKPELAPHHRNIEPLFKHSPATANPAAWLWEYVDKVGVWHEISSVEKPNPEDRRNIRPLYEHPPVAAAPTPPAGGGETEPGELMTRAWEAYSDKPMPKNMVEAPPHAFAAGYYAGLDDGRSTAASPASPAGDLNSLSAGAWRPMSTAPKDGKTQIVAKHKPNEHTPDGWVATITIDPDDGEYRRSGLDTIKHYNGDALMHGFHGAWTGWLYPHEVGVAPAAPRKGPSEDDVILLMVRGWIEVSGGDGSVIESVEEFAKISPEDYAACQKVAREILAILTPADRGETQAVNHAAEELARIRAVIPASLPYEVPDTAEAVASTFRAFVKAAAEATALRKQIAALKEGLGEPFMTCRAGGKTYEVNLAYRKLYDAQTAHSAIVQFFKPASSPDQNRGEPDQGGPNTEAGR